MKPPIVCLCGSTRFSKAFQQANLEETLAGRIVLTIGCDMRSDAELFADKSPEELEVIKSKLDELHLRKIDLANEVLILNVDGYIGASTRRELAHAITMHKPVRFLEPDKAAMALCQIGKPKFGRMLIDIEWFSGKYAVRRDQMVELAPTPISYREQGGFCIYVGSRNTAHAISDEEIEIIEYEGLNSVKDGYGFRCVPIVAEVVK
jgi:hypothetical protein